MTDSLTDSFDCRRCGTHYQPAKGEWILHDLCDKCFKLFDDQKMLGRIVGYGVAGDGNPWIKENYFESSDKWLKADQHICPSCDADHEDIPNKELRETRDVGEGTIVHYWTCPNCDETHITKTTVEGEH